MQNPSNVLYYKLQQGEDYHEIFHQEPLRPAPDGGAGALCAGEILRAIEGSVAPIPCLGSVTNECPMSEQCFTLPFWAGLDEVINQYIDSVTLEQLASQLPAPDSAAQESCCSCGGTKNEK